MNRRKWVQGKNRRAESNIVTAYLQNIEVSYSHLYQEMQQAVYDSETVATNFTVKCFKRYSILKDSTL